MKIKTQLKLKSTSKKNNMKPVIESYEDLIKSDLLDFINKQKEYEVWSECQIKIFKKKYNKKEYKYLDSSSNKQLSTFFTKLIKNRKKHFYLNRLYILLTSFVSNKYAAFIIQQLYKNPNITDREFIKLLNKADKNNKKPGIYGSDNNINIDECSEKIYELQNIFLHLKKVFTNIFVLPYISNSIKKLNFRYLDIGCGNGKKTKLVRDIFNIPKSMVHGTDIINWGPYSSDKHFDFTFKYILENGRLDFPDNYFGLITCFFTLHHVPHLSLLLQEIKRVLIPNGLLLIIEHDVMDIYDGLLIDLQHMMYSYLYDYSKNPKNYKNYINNPSLNRYFNIVEWDYIFSKYDFKFKNANVLYSSMLYNPTYDNQFYAIYQNIK